MVRPMKKRQIKASEVARYRTMYAGKQKYICPICEGSLTGKTALDHSHETGEIRATLCGTCNRSEGKAKKGAQYMAKITHLSKVDYIAWLKNLVKYLEFHKENPSGIIHPTWDVEEGKQKPIKRPRKNK